MGSGRCSALECYPAHSALRQYDHSWPTAVMRRKTLAMPFWWDWEVRECVAKVLVRMVMRTGTRKGRVERNPMVFCTPASRAQFLQSPAEPKSQVCPPPC